MRIRLNQSYQRASFENRLSEYARKMLADTGTMNIDDHKGTNSKLSYFY